MRQRRTLILLLCIFVAALAVLFGVREIRKGARAGTQEDTQTVLSTVTGETLCEISYRYDQNQVTFLYDNGAWRYPSDPDLPLNLDIPNRMYDTVTTLTSVRTVAKYTDKADYGFNNSSVQVSVKGKDGASYAFTIGSYVGYLDGYYIMISGDENIYFVLGEIRSPFSYHSSALVAMPPIPEIRAVNSLCVETAEEHFEAVLDTQLNQWYSLADDERIALNAISTRAAAGLLSRLEWSGCVAYDASEEEMAQYGLDRPTTILVGYTGADNRPGSLTLCIGSAVGSKYYARLPGSRLVMLIQGDLVTPLLNARLERLRAEP